MAYIVAMDIVSSLKLCIEYFHLQSLYTQKHDLYEMHCPYYRHCDILAMDVVSSLKLCKEYCFVHALFILACIYFWAVQ